MVARCSDETKECKLHSLHIHHSGMRHCVGFQGEDSLEVTQGQGQSGDDAIPGNLLRITIL